VIQSPPPTPHDIEMLIGGIIPIFGMLCGIIITGFVVLGPVGRAIGDVIRHLFGAGKRDQAAIGSGDVDEIVGRLDSIQHQLGELAERQDFSERMLAQVRKDRLPSGDVAG
jgi:hypothetical protein